MSILQKCLSSYKPHQENSIDEAVVGFKGRSSLKQYVPNKPTNEVTKFGVGVIVRMGLLAAFKYMLVGSHSTEKILVAGW